MTALEMVPGDDTGPHVKGAAWILRIVIACQAIGAALPLIRGLDHSSLNSYLFLNLHLEESLAQTIDLIAGYTLLVAALLTIIYPIGPIVILTGIWAGILAWATVQTDGTTYPELAPFAGAMRIMSPLALLFLIAWPKRYAHSKWRGSVAMLLLRLAIAAAFIAHGIEAFRLLPKFTDLIITAGDNLLGAAIEEPTAHWLLRLIGTADIAIAIALIGTCPCFKRKSSWLKWGWRTLVGAGAGAAVMQLEQLREPATFVTHLSEQGTYWFGIEITTTFLINTSAIVVGLCVAWITPHWRAITWYMAFWGIITALSRMIYQFNDTPFEGGNLWQSIKHYFIAFGGDGLDGTLLRLTHFGAPLAMYTYWRSNQPKQEDNPNALANEK